jgi:hypothetical protein
MMFSSQHIHIHILSTLSSFSFNLSASWDRLCLSTSAVCSRRDFWALLTSILHDTLEFLANVLDALSTAARDSRNITKVGVDAHQVGSNTVGLDIGDNNVARSAVLAAISTAAEQLSNTDDRVILDGHSATTVVLNNLVLGVLSTTSLDEDASSSLESDGI